MLKHLLFSILSLGIFAHAQVSIGNDTYTQKTPLDASSNYSYSQTIYSKNSVGSSGNITGIEFYLSDYARTIDGITEVQVFMKNVSQSNFSSANDYVLDDLTSVFDGTVTFDEANKKYVITLDQPFAYDNQYNLLVAVLDKDSGYGSYSTSFKSTKAEEYSSVVLQNKFGSEMVDPSNPSAYSELKIDFIPNITLLGLDAPSGNDLPACPKVTSPVDGATNVNFLPVINYEQISNADGYNVSLGTTPNGTEIYDNYDNGTYTDFFVSDDLQPKTKYYVSVYPKNAAGVNTSCASSSFTTGEPVANDNCDTATDVSTFPYSSSGTGEYASAINGNVTCDNIDTFEVRDGLWYAIKGDGNEITVTVEPSSYWDPSLALKDACDAGDCVKIAKEGGLYEAETLSFESEKDKIYYLVVGYNGGLPILEDKFKINITSSNLSTDNVEYTAIKVYPNPTQDYVYVKGVDVKKLALYDLTGSLIGEATNTDKISLKGKANGIYVLQITDKEGKTITQKVIKK